MDLDELIARESIRDLVARYNSTADSGRFDETLVLFAPEAVMDTDGERHEGRDAIHAMFEGAKTSLAAHAGGAPRYLRHFTSTLQIDVTGTTTAKARCYYQVILPHGLDHWGRYIDEFGVVDGRWLFTSRREVLDGWVEGGWAVSTVVSCRASPARASVASRTCGCSPAAPATRATCACQACCMPRSRAAHSHTPALRESTHPSRAPGPV